MKILKQLILLLMILCCGWAHADSTALQALERKHQAKIGVYVLDTATG